MIYTIMKKLLLLCFAILLLAGCWHKQVQVVDNSDTQIEQTNYANRGLTGSFPISELEDRWRMP